VLEETVAAAAEDAGQLVLRDLRTRSVAAGRRGARARRRRVSVHRRVSAATAAAVVAVTSLAATEGVAAATGHGFGVARMPARSAALVVAPRSLPPLQRRTGQLVAARAAVLVPDRLTPGDVMAAKGLAAAGVPLVARGCAPATLVSHPEAHACGATLLLARVGVRTAPVVVSDGDVEGLALVVAHRDGTRIVIGEPVGDPVAVAGTGTKAPASRVWVVRQRGGETPAALLRAVRRQADLTTSTGWQLRPVTDARPGR
jgi:hypothetical protein